MIEFLLKVWRMARPYRGRLLLGVLTGIVGGLIEPLMVATVVFVYGAIFPSAESDSVLLTPRDFKDTPALIAELSHQTNSLARFLWNEFPARDRQLLMQATLLSNRPPIILVRNLNYLLQGDSLYDDQRFAGIKLSQESRRLLGKEPKGEEVPRLNRLLLHDAFPAAISPSLASPLDKRLSWAPDFVRQWTLSVQQAFSTSVEAHPLAVFALVGLIPLVILLRGVFSYLNVYFLQWTAIRTITDLRTRLFGHLMHLSAGFFSRTSTGELMSRVMNDTATLQGIISNATAVMVKDPVTIVSLLTYLMWEGSRRRLTLISMVVMPICMVPILIYNRKVRRASRDMQTRSAELSRGMAESFTGSRVIKAYNLESVVVDRFRNTAGKFIGHYMRIVRSSELPGPMLEFVGAIGLCLVLLYLSVQGHARPSAPDFLAFIISIFAMYRPMKNLTRLYNSIEQARAASERVFELLATENDLPEPVHPKPLHAAGAAVHFDSVSFSYGDKSVLHDISLTVPPGRLVAVVGASGSGKTTLTSLLLRFYDPQHGAIRIGDTDIREVTSRDLRSQIAVVAQETVLFNETVARNIELGRPGATKKEIVEAAGHAYAYDFIMEKPNGFETSVGEKGVLISGGQRQRIAIARAILKDAPILILDEATSSLDTESERAVQAALEELMRGRTTICIAHRLSTIQKADLIVVLDQGRIVESGTHAELMQSRGIYHKLHELQFQPATA